MIHRRKIHLDGIDLSYLEQGTPQPGVPSLLILHGLIATAETFQRFAAQLPDRHLLALDLPGSGYSDRPAANVLTPSFAALASLVLHFADAMHLHQPILLGHSHGGAIALQIVVSRPDWPRALILISPAHPFSGQEKWLIRFYLSLPGRLFARSLPLLPRQLHLYAFRRMPGSRTHFDYDDLAPYAHTLKMPGTIPYLLRLLGSWQQDMAALKAEIERHAIATPTLLLWGDRDVVVPLATAQRLLPHFQHAELRTLDGRGHLPNDEAPEECAALVQSWLDSSFTG